MKYDAVIVGASFAGLAVASRLRGKILLIDRKDIGTGQTSACGTLLNVPQALGCSDSVLQVYHQGYLHTPEMTVEYDLPHPFCAFDYPRFCHSLLQKAQAEFVKARVIGVEEGRVMTDKGEFEATCLVDASGWKATLAISLEQSLVNRATLSFGLGTEVPLRGSGLYFWMDPSVMPNGVGWLFPCGDYSRMGVASYGGDTAIKKRLDPFAGRLDTTGNSVHEGFLPWRLRPATVGNMFVVGDAAGQCLPLTGEGIRPALYFGMKCGDLVQRVIWGELSLGEALRLYQAQVDRHRKAYFLLELLQRQLPRLSPPWLVQVLYLVRVNPLWHWLLNSYEQMVAPRMVADRGVSASSNRSLRVF